MDIKSFDMATIQGEVYYSIHLFMKLHGLKTSKSVYDWVNKGKAEKKKIGNNSFFALKKK